MEGLVRPEKGDPTTFAQDSAVVVSELTAAQMAQMLLSVGNTAEKAEQDMLRDLREKVYNPEISTASNTAPTSMRLHRRWKRTAWPMSRP